MASPSRFGSDRPPASEEMREEQEQAGKESLPVPELGSDPEPSCGSDRPSTTEEADEEAGEDSDGGSESESESSSLLSSVSYAEGLSAASSAGAAAVVTSDETQALLWLQALESQVVGVCREDERLKPLLKLNSSCGAAEERFLSQLSQHFEVQEIGMLARCLCIPLVSIRVGKVEKRGNLLCPTNNRGQLNLSLLPSSSMSVSFAGDDGCLEQLVLLTCDVEEIDVLIKHTLADVSGRSFHLKIGASNELHYWCAEKSRENGMEAVAKMKDLLDGRPTLSQLTGISETRLGAFATHLHAFLLGSGIREVNSFASLCGFLNISFPQDSHLHPSKNLPRSSRFRTSTTHATKVNSIYQASLSPRSNTFKDGGAPRISCAKGIVREKLKRRSDCQIVPSLSSYTKPINLLSAQTISEQLQSKCEERLIYRDCFSLPLSNHLPTLALPSTNNAPLHTNCVPQYCWCTPSPSLLSETFSSSRQASALIENLPSSSLMSLLSSTETPVLDPLLRLTLPTSTLASLSASPIPTFTPLMTDPIVHIPIIGVCSSGQGYLVSAGPAIPSIVPLPSFVNPLIPESESLVERSARETLRMLMASAPAISGTQSMNGSIPFTAAENYDNLNVYKPVVPSSSQFPCSTFSVDALANGIFFMCLKPETEGDRNENDANVSGGLADGRDDCGGPKC